MSGKKRQAYSLLELLVASAIFAGIILLATSNLTASVSVRDQEQASSEVTNYAESLVRQVSQQISYATSVSTVSAGSSWIAAAVPALDDYGRIKQPVTTSDVAYCTSSASVFHTYSPGSLPTANPCPPSETNPNTYSVTMSVTPLVSGMSPSAVQVQITVKGSVGSSAGARVFSTGLVSYTATKIIEYGNTALPYENVE